MLFDLFVQVKEVDLERLKELSEQQRAQLNVPFHSLRPEEEVPQTLLEKADHDLIGAKFSKNLSCMFNPVPLLIYQSTTYQSCVQCIMICSRNGNYTWAGTHCCTCN